MDETQLPLHGLRVIDLTSVAMGPYASQWLADFGADVIKVEAPEGDSTRATGPAREAGMAAMFLALNRNKRSVVLDLKTAEGRAALLRLLTGADVLVHNIRAQKLADLGLAPEALRASHPRLIHASLQGFGEGGPYAGRPAYDDVIQGLSGSVDLMRRLCGEPRSLPTIIADKTTGLIAALAILAAVVRRGRSGDGCHVEVPMFEAMVAFNLVEHMYGMHFEPPLAPAGYPRVLSRNRGPFASADGHVCIMPYTDAQWRAFFDFAGAPALASDPRFADQAARTRNVDALYGAVAEIARGRPTAEWLALCEAHQVPAAPVHTLDALFDDPHLTQVGFFPTLDDADMGRVRLTAVPIRFDGQRPPVRTPARLGAQTREVLKEAGLTEEEITALEARRGQGAKPG